MKGLAIATVALVAYTVNSFTAPPQPLAAEPVVSKTFFPLASAPSVEKCRAAALAFDTNRRAAMAERVVAVCEADAAAIADPECKMYAVRVASAASKFVHQMRMIEANNPAWQGMTDVIRDHNARAREHAGRCKA